MWKKTHLSDVFINSLMISLVGFLSLTKFSAHTNVRQIAARLSFSISFICSISTSLPFSDWGKTLRYEVFIFAFWDYLLDVSARFLWKKISQAIFSTTSIQMYMLRAYSKCPHFISNEFCCLSYPLAWKPSLTARFACLLPLFVHAEKLRKLVCDCAGLDSANSNEFC